MNIPNNQTTYSAWDITRSLVHDMRTPISTLALIIKDIQDNIPSDKAHTATAIVERMNVIMDTSMKRIKQTEQSVQDWQSVAGSIDTDYIWIDKLIKQIMREKIHQYRASGVTFVYTCSEGGKLAKIKANASDFARMLSNLLNNAVEACEDRIGTATIELSTYDQVIKLSVRDNGKGMPPEIVDKIRNNITVTHDKIGGNGIGMRQIKATVAHSEGKLHIHSTPGEGTTIDLLFLMDQ